MNKKISILIMEEVPSAITHLEDKLKGLGFGLCRHDGPDKPIDELDAKRPDLVVLGPSLSTGIALRCVHKFKIINPIVPILTSCTWDDEMTPGESESAPFAGIHYIDPNPGPSP